MIAAKQKAKRTVEAPIDFYAMIFLFTAGTGALIVAPDWALALGQNLANHIPGVHLDLVPKSGEEKQQAAGTGTSALDENAKFELGYQQVMKWESASCSNTAGDGGGLTCRGITDASYQAWLKNKGMQSKPVISITEREAKEIYRTEYWEPSGAGKLPLKLAVIAFDIAVNSPMHRVNEIIGSPQTDVDAWAKAALDRRETYYKTVAGKGDQAKFIPGWLNRNNDLRKFVATLKDEPASGHESAAGAPADGIGLSTFGLYAGLDFGTGVCVAPDRLLTALHVVKEGNVHMGITDGKNRKSVAVRVTKTDSANDLALVQIPIPCHPIAVGETPTVGTALEITGNSGDTLHSFTGKVVSVAARTTQYQPEAVKGDSGGPVLAEGKLVGISVRAGEGRTTAISINTIKEFLR